MSHVNKIMRSYVTVKPYGCVALTEYKHISSVYFQCFFFSSVGMARLLRERRGLANAVCAATWIHPTFNDP